MALNYVQAKKIMKDSMPSSIYWGMSLEFHCYRSGGIEETRRVYIGDPIREFFGDGKTWQSAVDKALVAARKANLIGVA